MNLVDALLSAISDKDLAKLPELKTLTLAELARLEGKSSKNYANHLRSLLRELESVMSDAKPAVKAEAKPKPAITSGASHFFGR